MHRVVTVDEDLEGGVIRKVQLHAWVSGRAVNTCENLSNKDGWVDADAM